MKRSALSVLFVTFCALWCCGQAMYRVPPSKIGHCPYADPRLCQPVTPVVPVAALPLFQLFHNGPDAGIWASGSAVVAETGQTITLARGSAAYCQGSTYLSLLSSGSPCVEPNGLTVRPATIQLAAYSADIRKWTYDHGFIDGGVGPTPGGDDSGVVLCPNTDTTSAREFYRNHVTPGAGDYVLSFWMRPHTTDSAWLRSYAGAASNVITWDLDSGFVGAQTNSHYGLGAGLLDFNVLPAANGWIRYSQKIHEDIGVSYTEFFTGKDYASAQGSWTGTGSNNCIDMWGPLLTNTEDLRMYVPNTTTGNVTQAGDVASFANPLGNTDNSWCVGANVTVDGLAWDAWRDRGIFGIGYDAGMDSNTAALYVNDGGSAVFTIVDNSGGVATATSNTRLWAGTRYVRACTDGGGAGGLSLSMDQKVFATTASGTGTARITTQPAIVYINSIGGNASGPKGQAQLGGSAMDYCIDRFDGGTNGCSIAWGFRPAYTPKSLWAWGDSLTHNSLATSYYPELLAVDLPTWHIVNGGLAASNFVDFWNLYLGWRASDEGTNWGGYGYQYVSYMANINNTTPAVAEVELMNKVFFDKADSHVRGAQVVFMLESPWAHSGSWSTGAQTKFGQLQTWTAAYATSTGRLYSNLYVDMRDAGAGDPPTLACIYDYGTDGTDGCTNNNYVHWNSTGQVFGKNELKAELGQ